MAELERLRPALQGRSLLMAASTHEGEDAIVAEAHCQLRQTVPDLCTIIAPRHPERGAAISEMLEGKGLSVARRSLGALPDRTSDAYIADTIGELGMLYKLAPVAFIGGSLVDRGGQNPIEAVRQGAAVLTGPHWQNFSDTYNALINNRAAIVVRSAPELASAAGRLLADQTELGRMHSRANTALAALSGALAAHGGGAAAAPPGRRRFRACLLTSRPGGIAMMPAAWRLVWRRWPRSTAGPPLRATRGLQPYRSRLPVICAGNFTAGGTGKTPLVLHLCERLRAAGHASRGADPRLWRAARRTALGQPAPTRADDVGDEALLLARTRRR